MKKLNLHPRGTVKRSVNWGTNKVEFENGLIQRQRKWISPRVTFTIDAYGTREMRDYIENFFYEVNGDNEAFEWSYDDTTYVVRFGESSIEFEEIRELQKVVGYHAQFSLVVQKESEY